MLNVSDFWLRTMPVRFNHLLFRICSEAKRSVAYKEKYAIMKKKNGNHSNGTFSFSFRHKILLDFIFISSYTVDTCKINDEIE